MYGIFKNPFVLRQAKFIFSRRLRVMPQDRFVLFVTIITSRADLDVEVVVIMATRLYSLIQFWEVYSSYNLRQALVRFKNYKYKYVYNELTLCLPCSKWR